MKRKITFGIIFLLVLGLLATVMITAENETAINDSNPLEDLTQEKALVSEVNQTISEADNIMPEKDIRIIGRKRVTLFDGWVVNSEETSAELIKGTWITKKYIPVPVEKIQEIRDKYSGDKEKVLQEIKTLKLEPVAKSYGKISIGVGPSRENFRLVNIEITNESALFYLIPIKTPLKELDENSVEKESAGKIDLKKLKFPHLTLWAGTLSIKSGTYKGTWDVNIKSKTKLFRRPIPRKPRRSFWDRLKFWKKAKTEKLTNEDLQKMRKLKISKEKQRIAKEKPINKKPTIRELNRLRKLRELKK